jgi:hypothetical protein
MTLTAGRILRSNNVKLSGAYQLDIAQGASRAKLARQPAGPLTPKVRIAENRKDFAIIEVSCGCGEIIRIKCNYGSATASGQSANTKPTQETQNAVS